jgi:hypothetical protein
MPSTRAGNPTGDLVTSYPQPMEPLLQKLVVVLAGISETVFGGSRI